VISRNEGDRIGSEATLVEQFRQDFELPAVPSSVRSPVMTRWSGRARRASASAAAARVLRPTGSSGRPRLR